MFIPDSGSPLLETGPSSGSGRREGAGPMEIGPIPCPSCRPPIPPERPHARNVWHKSRHDAGTRPCTPGLSMQFPGGHAIADGLGRFRHFLPNDAADQVETIPAWWRKLLQIGVDRIRICGLGSTGHAPGFSIRTTWPSISTWSPGLNFRRIRYSTSPLTRTRPSSMTSRA